MHARFGGRFFAGLRSMIKQSNSLPVWLVAAVMSLMAAGTCAEDSWDAIVDAEHAGNAGAIPEDVPVYRTLSDALKLAHPDADSFRIFLRDGLYMEKISIERPGVQLRGESRDGTIIRWDDHGDTLGPGSVRLGTAGSAALTVSAPRFSAHTLTIVNGFDYPANRRLPEGHPDKVANAQAVAVRTTADSDQAVFDNVTILGYQDTLFVDAGRHYFRDCRIAGHVDFIFGAGQAVFESCDIVSRNRPGKNPSGYITAPSTPAVMPYGLLFLESRLIKEEPDIPAGSVRLGRPWHPEANPGINGSAVFIDCYMDDHIGPEGFAPISARNAAGERIWFEVGDDSRFFEYGSHGSGGAESEHRPQLTEGQVRWYSPSQVLNGWKPWQD